MLVIKKMNQKKTILLSIVGIFMFAGIVYFVYLNYSLTNMEYSGQTIIKLEPINIGKAISTPLADSNQEPIASSSDNNEKAEIQSEHDFINKKKWQSLIQTDYSIPEKIATGTDNPYNIRTKQVALPE
jgi:hypothetical protein